MLTSGAAAAALPLTHVTLRWRGGVQEDWLRFGKPVAQLILDRRRRIESYGPGQIFARVRWAANEFGTVRSLLDIVRAAPASPDLVPLPGIEPGSQLLLSVRGWPKVAQLFALIDDIEAAGIEPCAVAPEHWCHVHNRIAGREELRPYSPARLRAWLRRKALQP